MKRILAAALGVFLVAMAFGPWAYATGAYLGGQQAQDGRIHYGPGGAILTHPGGTVEPVSSRKTRRENNGPFTAPNVTVEIFPLATADTSEGPMILATWDGPVPILVMPSRRFRR